MSCFSWIKVDSTLQDWWIWIFNQMMLSKNGWQNPAKSHGTFNVNFCVVLSGLKVMTHYTIREFGLPFSDQMMLLIHWGQMMHKCVSKLTIIGSDNDLLPGWCQAIIWSNARILWIRNLGTNFSEILSKIHTFSIKKMQLKMGNGGKFVSASMC